MGLGRQFVAIASLLGVFSLLVSTIPAAFLYSGKTYQTVETPTEWDAGLLLLDVDNRATIPHDNDTITKGITGNKVYLEIPAAGGNISVSVGWWSYEPDNIYADHWWYSWWILTEYDAIKPSPIQKSYVLSNQVGNYSIFQARCLHYQYLIQIHYDETSYASLEDAWNHGELRFWIGVGNYTETGFTQASYSGWTLVAQLLTFQAPDMLAPGALGVFLNALIAIPLWAAVSYLAFAIVVKIIHGGGD